MSMSEPSLGPYARAAGAYWDAGWHGALPLPVGRKASPPKGYTGAEHDMPSFADITAWCQGSEGDGNIGIRLPRHVIGIDVDQYGAKRGANELYRLSSIYGPLPPTWITGSRLETGSGISLYTVPEGLAWPGEVAPAVEIIQYRHRYAVVWPSIHPEGRTYRWQMPSGLTSFDALPQVDELPALPDAWVSFLTGGVLETDYPHDLDVDAFVWLSEHGGGEPCRQMREAIEGYLRWLARPETARHEVAKAATMRIARMISEGHHGGNGALNLVLTAFQAATVGEQRNVLAEWSRMIKGAVSIAAVEPIAPGDPCSPNFAELGDFAIVAVPHAPAEQTDNVGLLDDMGVPLATAGVNTGEPAQATGHSGTEQDATTAEHSSWFPQDIENLLAGQNSTPEPTFLQRADGASLFYPGKVNGIIGESESGKSFVALLAVTQALAAGLTASYLDFEDTGATVIERLRALGVSDTAMREQFHYIGPTEALNALASQELRGHLESQRPDVIVLDGMNAAMTLLGLDLMSNTDATKFTQLLLGPLRSLGGQACVIYVDHLPKSKENETKGGIGAQAKRAMTDGCALRAEVVSPFGRGKSGSVKLSVDKDRPGHVRGGLDTTLAGMFIVTANDDGTLALSVEKPSGIAAVSKVDKKNDTDIKAREGICRYLGTLPSKTDSKRQVELNSGSGVAESRRARQWLIDYGYLTLDERPNGHYLTMKKRYSSLQDGLISEHLVSSSETSSDSSTGEGEIGSELTSSLTTPKVVRRESSPNGVMDEEELSNDEERDETNPPPVVVAKLPGGDEQAAAVRACVKSGGKPGFIDGRLVDMSTGEVLL